MREQFEKIKLLIDKIEKVVGEKVRISAAHQGCTWKEIDISEENFYALFSEKGLSMPVNFLLGAEKSKEIISRFSLAPFPGCCGIVISTGSYVGTKYRGKGIGSLLNELRQLIAILLGYTVIAATDVEQNIPQRKLLSKNKWSDIFKFKNKRTGNTVFISAKELK